MPARPLHCGGRSPASSPSASTPLNCSAPVLQRVSIARSPAQDSLQFAHWEQTSAHRTKFRVKTRTQPLPVFTRLLGSFSTSRSHIELACAGLDSLRLWV